MNSEQWTVIRVTPSAWVARPASNKNEESEIASVSVSLPLGEGGPRPVGSYFRPQGGTPFCAKGANIVFVCVRKTMLPYGKWCYASHKWCCDYRRKRNFSVAVDEGNLYCKSRRDNIQSIFNLTIFIFAQWTVDSEQKRVTPLTQGKGTRGFPVREIKIGFPSSLFPPP